MIQPTCDTCHGERKILVGGFRLECPNCRGTGMKPTPGIRLVDKNNPRESPPVFMSRFGKRVAVWDLDSALAWFKDMAVKNPDTAVFAIREDKMDVRVIRDVRQATEYYRTTPTET